ncbi:MAG: hypothetical protein WBG46_03905 [Nonlabens sp.]
MKYLAFFLLTITILTSCKEKPELIQNELIHHIPESSKVIINTDDLEPLQNWLEGNELLQQIKNLSRFQEVIEASNFLSQYQINDHSFITLSMEGRNETVITLITNDYEFASPNFKSNDSTVYNGNTIFKTSTNDHFYTNFGDLHIASSSRLVVESLLRRSIKDYVFDERFSSIYSRTGNSDFNIYIKGANDEWLKQYLAGNNIKDPITDAYWYQIEPEFSEEYIQLDGIVSYADTVKIYQSLFNKIIPKGNKIPEITPVSASQLTSVSFSKSEKLMENLKSYHSKEIKTDAFLNALLENTQELGTVQMEATNTIAFTLKPYESLFIDLNSLSIEKYTYRNQEIHKLNRPFSTTPLAPVINRGNYDYVAHLSGFMVFSKKASTIETIISNVQNKTVIAQQNWYQKVKSRLSDESTLLKLTSVESFKKLPTIRNNSDIKILKTIDTQTYPFVISQYVHEDEYAHYHFLMPLVKESNAQSATGQLMTYRFAGEMVHGPFLFPNHLSKQHDVAFQDDELNLHLVNNKGKLLWSKKLDDEIIGDIHAVDVYKNGRKQLAFTTKKSVYLLDRKGRDVNAFPYKIKNGITQPLSVFDYDKSRNYRFLATSGSRLTMLNREGEIVTGFKYQPDEIITSPPLHHRTGTKDFISFLTENESIKILSRVGRVRTPINQPINSKDTIYFEDEFALIQSENNEVKKVNLITGKVLSEKADLNNASHYVRKVGMVLFQKNNELSINGKKIDLPYGTYSDARIQLVNKEPFAVLVEQGDSNIYIIDLDGDVIPGLPVYGSNPSDIAVSNVRYLVTKDDQDIILYKW